MSSAALIVTVKDEDVTSDDDVAIGRVNLQNCKVYNPSTNNYQIRLYYESNDAGILYFDTTFTPWLNKWMIDKI